MGGREKVFAKQSLGVSPPALGLLKYLTSGGFFSPEYD